MLAKYSLWAVSSFTKAGNPSLAHTIEFQFNGGLAKLESPSNL